MQSFYYDIFLMLLTYGILGVLTYRLMKSRKRHFGGNNDDGGKDSGHEPIIPDLPEGVIWPKKEEVFA